jgi:hypothetical protein
MQADSSSLSVLLDCIVGNDVRSLLFEYLQPGKFSWLDSVSDVPRDIDLQLLRSCRSCTFGPQLWYMGQFYYHGIWSLECSPGEYDVYLQPDYVVVCHQSISRGCWPEQVEHMRRYVAGTNGSAASFLTQLPGFEDDTNIRFTSKRTSIRTFCFFLSFNHVCFCAVLY